MANGLGNDQFIKELLVDVFPYFILIDKDKKIVKLNIELAEVEEFLLRR